MSSKSNHWQLAAACALGSIMVTACSDASKLTDAGATGAPPDGGVVAPELDAGDAGDAAADGSTPGADDGSTPSDSGSPEGSVTDGSPGTPVKAGCIKELDGVNVVRGDGKVLLESGGEQPVFDAATGLPLVGAQNVAGGSFHGCAVVSGGGVECWQSNTDFGNSSGQLGNGTTTAIATTWRATPVLTAPGTPLTNAIRVTASGSATCAVTSDKKLWCWGDLTWLVNNGTKRSVGYAQAITTDGAAPLTGVLQASIGSNEGCAVVEGSPNAVYCWGSNGYQQLAQGDTNPRQYPTKVLGLASPTKVAISAVTNGSSDTVCAMDGDGVRCWGSNFVGAAGSNSSADVVGGPTAVVTQNGAAALAGVVDVAPGFRNFSVLRTDGSLWTWGGSTTSYAGNFGVTNVVDIGYAGGYSQGDGPRYLTSDGVYHSANTTVPVNCGVL